MDSTYTILIADDHPLFRNALFQSVHMAISGANILEADSITGLFDLLAKEEPDLLLLDLKMPGANGMSGLIQLRCDYPHLPIVVISARSENLRLSLKLNAMVHLGLFLNRVIYDFS